MFSSIEEKMANVIFLEERMKENINHLKELQQSLKDLINFDVKGEENIGYINGKQSNIGTNECSIYLNKVEAPNKQKAINQLNFKVCCFMDQCESESEYLEYVKNADITENTEQNVIEY